MVRGGLADAPTLVCLHGFLGAAADWRPLFAAIEPGYAGVAIDLPGHGASVDRPAADYTFAGAARRIEATLDGLNVHRAALLGYSMGGRLALALALTNPARWQALVLESSPPGIADSEARAVRRRDDDQWAARLETEPIEAVLHDWYAQPIFASLARESPRLAQVIATRCANDPRALARALQGLGAGSQPSLWERLADLRVPTLLLAGGEDARYRELTARMQDLCPVARRVIVPGAGHNIHLEQPVAFRDALLAHLKEHP